MARRFLDYSELYQEDSPGLRRRLIISSDSNEGTKNDSMLERIGKLIFPSSILKFPCHDGEEAAGPVPKDS